jgi:acyl carrier protein
MSQFLKWRWGKTADQMATDFAQSRSPQSDAEFLQECNLPDNAQANHAALAVRRSIASYAMIDSAFIRAADRYPHELTKLSGWDSIDFVEWLLKLEIQLDKPINTEWFADLPQTYCVRDLAARVYQGSLE